MRDSILRTNAGRVVHAVRKFHGYGQVELAQEFKLSQSNISKIESGILIPDLFFWMDFSRAFSVSDPYCFSYGAAEIRGIPKLGKVERSFYKRVGFKIPRDLLSDPLITSRKIRPLIHVFEKNLTKPWGAFLEATKIPAPMFDILNFPIPTLVVKALADFAQQYDSKLDIYKDLNLTAQVNHGLLFEDYARASTTFTVLQRFIHRQRDYGIEMEYLISEEKEHESTVKIHVSSQMLDVFSRKELLTNKFLNFSANYPLHLMKMKDQAANPRMIFMDEAKN